MANRLLIVANKAWETDPLVGVFGNEQARPPKFLEPEPVPQVSIPMSDGTTKTVKARLALRSPKALAEVWCVRDLMDPKKSSSSSEEKARVLPSLLSIGDAPSLVVAFGTAAFPDAMSYNGCVVAGSSVFVHDAYGTAPNPESQWGHPSIGKLLEPSQKTMNGALFTSLDREWRAAIEARFMRSPLNPAGAPSLIVSASYVALSNVNITNPNNYAWADPEGLRAVAAAAPHESVGSVETTHGVIRVTLPAQQFVFISGIANRLGYFNMELAPRSYAQNFVASHNAAVCLAWMLPALMA